MPRTRKNTRSINSLAEARNVCSRIFSPDECRVNLNSLSMRMMMVVVIVIMMIFRMMIRMMIKMIFSPDEYCVNLNSQSMMVMDNMVCDGLNWTLIGFGRAWLV